jgi:hypothetical protein
MKTVISNNEGFRTIVEVNPVAKPVGHVQVKFSTEWDHARRDGTEQVQYSLILSAAQLKNLRDLL